MADAAAVDQFITDWHKTGGSELANTQSFINALCALIGTAPPSGSRTDDKFNDYVFERRVFQNNGDGTESFGRIDAYKRGCFILEAKQGSEADRAAIEKGQDDLDLFGQTALARVKRGTAKRGTPGWTKAMVQAKGQAERYAKALPADHGWPPFLLIADIGYCIEVYADFTCTGRAYGQYPDRSSFRIMLEDLRDESVAERLRIIWNDPKSLDPSKIAAQATREIAALLATVARRLEARGHSPEEVSAFLMRLIFTMFAEDTRMIPERSFSDLLGNMRAHPKHLHHQLSALWDVMDKGGFAPALGVPLRRFNGYLFKDRGAIPLEAAELDVLIEAARADWRQVEPAIFGTLLQRALNPKERARLGAHYTPRAYVERLVMPTVIEPLRAEWNGVRTAATQLIEEGQAEEARREVERFHSRLAQATVLDPACGTGNFLYIAMARMKELESEVVELLSELGDVQYVAELSGHTITPENFLGIEVNPRAAAIAQLVLWIGYLQWHFRVVGKNRMPSEPILKDIRTIENRDALIVWEKKDLERDQTGAPVTRWDGETMKPHPVTGKPVPDEAAQVDVFRYTNPRATKWPKATFVVGNPPFVGNKRMKDRLGVGYVKAVRNAYPNVSEAVDFVMYWWQIAAGMPDTKFFGFITTNSISQQSNRTVLESNPAIRLAFAIPNHPWVNGADGAAVRIAMTVGTRQDGPSILETVLSEEPIPGGNGERDIQTTRAIGDRITSSLTLGSDVHSCTPLNSNRGLSCPGVQLSGQGFILDEKTALQFGERDRPLIKTYITGWELNNRTKNRFVIDAFGLTESELRSRHPQVYQYLYAHVRPERIQNPRPKYAREWWIHAEPRARFRETFTGIARFCVTSRTSKHRVFEFRDSTDLPETKVLIIALGDAFHLAVLNSRFHVLFSTAAGARLGVGHDPTYNHSECFDPFPFPQDMAEPVKKRARAEGEALDALRKRVLSQHEDLTLTSLYNVLEALRVGRELTRKERDIHDRGLVTLILQHHEKIDVAVAEAYGWPANMKDDEVITRLIELNRSRSAEEKAGNIRWLRPDLHTSGMSAAVGDRLDLGDEAEPEVLSTAFAWPKALPDQVTAVARVLAAAGKPLSSRDVARAFSAKRASTVSPVLDALAAIGQARRLEDGRYAL